MLEAFIKGYLEEDQTWFYTHFRNNLPVRQIELSSTEKIFISDQTEAGRMRLPEATYDTLDEEGFDCISKIEFDEKWNERALSPNERIIVI